MSKWIAALAALGLMSVAAGAQDTTAAKAPKKDKAYWSKVNLGDRANDHLMIQFGMDGWAGKPEDIRTGGFSRHFNAYFMLDRPWKTDPRWSVGLGAGVGSSHIFFKNMEVDLAGRGNPANQVRFIDVTDTTRFKKYKLATVWLEAPVELRYVTNPLNSNKSWKFAVGAKIGTMVSGMTKGKNLLNSQGNSIFGKSYIEKEKDRKFLNGTRLAGTMRVGYGNFTLYGAYQITSLFREGQGPEVRPYSIGLCLSGL